MDKSSAAPTTDGPDGAYAALDVLEDVLLRKKKNEPIRVICLPGLRIGARGGGCENGELDCCSSEEEIPLAAFDTDTSLSVDRTSATCS